jgi:hypothetical protein
LADGWSKEREREKCFATNNKRNVRSVIDLIDLARAAAAAEMKSNFSTEMRTKKVKSFPFQ